MPVKYYQMPPHRKAPVPASLLTAASRWLPDTSCSDCTITARTLSCGLAVRFIRLSHPRMTGKRILFFSDTHFRTDTLHCFFPRARISGGVDWMERAFSELFSEIPAPDCILFGGDFASETSWIAPACDMMRRALPAHVPKYAVSGNWEHRRIWLDTSKRRSFFARAGFELLDNPCGVRCGGLVLHTCGDAKETDRILPPSFEKDGAFHCILTHSPDAVPLLDDAGLLQDARLILCGHTHGGQCRIPGFGALVTSSRFGKTFEYGLYRRTDSGTRLYVTSGIGGTWFHFRVFCPPEVILIDFS